jgi:hypothetical protein
MRKPIPVGDGGNNPGARTPDFEGPSGWGYPLEQAMNRRAIAAERVVRHLERAGFVFTKKSRSAGVSFKSLRKPVPFLLGLGL